MKKLLSLALALLLLAVMLPVVSMADEITWVESKNVYWQAGDTSSNRHSGRSFEGRLYG